MNFRTSAFLLSRYGIMHLSIAKLYVLLAH
jgi:hypothetical protein